MTRGFAGNTTFAQRARRKMLFAISGLGSVVVILFSVVTYMVLGGSESTPTAIAMQEDAVIPKTDTVDVVVAARRIESGTRLDPSMFSLYSYEKDRVPYGIIPASDEGMANGMYAKRMIRAGFPIVQEDLTEDVPLDKLPIPPGYRAVAIFGTQTELVNGYVVPNSRVDVLFHYTDQRNRKAVKTLVDFVKVLSVNGTDKNTGKANVGAGATATLLVTIRDAQRIELARRMGQLTLALRGTSSNGTEPGDQSPVTPCDVVGDCGKAGTAVPDGTMLIPGPDGKLIKYVLEGNKWRRVHEDEETI